MVNARAKGRTGEYEARDLIIRWLSPVYEAAAVAMPEVKRNIEQWRSGGYDLVGIEWLALECKRVEQVHLDKWWRQTLAATRPGQVPFLLWRRNRQRWSARTVVNSYHGHDADAYLFKVVADLDEAGAEAWLQAEAWSRLRHQNWS